AGLTAELVDRLRSASEAAGLFDELATSWLLLDAELLPWSAKAGQLLRDQYASVGAAARASLPAAIGILEQAITRDIGTRDIGTRDIGTRDIGDALAPLLARTRSRLANAGGFA